MRAAPVARSGPAAVAHPDPDRGGAPGLRRAVSRAVADPAAAAWRVRRAAKGDAAARSRRAARPDPAAWRVRKAAKGDAGGTFGTGGTSGSGGTAGTTGGRGGISGTTGSGGVAGTLGGRGGMAGTGPAGRGGSGGTAGGGGTGGAACSTCWTAILPIEARDIVYSAARNELYASVPGDAAAYPNTIVVIDPTTASVGSAIPVGSNPGALALSDDGSTLWVGIEGAHAFRKVTMNATPPVVGPLIHLPKASPDLYFDATSMAVLAGAPLSVVMVLSDGGYTRPRSACSTTACRARRA